jgi:hypothetical protein
MQYQSPIKILSSFLNDNVDFSNTDFNVLKRRILAEFELSGNPTISTEEGEFSKNDILDIFENQKNKEDFQYHLIVAKMPVLLNFLEYYTLEEKLNLDEPVFKDEKFINFLSPYLAGSFGNFFAACIHDPNMEIRHALQKHYPILPEHESYLLEPVYSVLDQIISDVEEIRASFPGKDRLHEADGYFSNGRIRVFNRLPQKYFLTAVELYTICGIDFIIDFLDKNHGKMVHSSDISFVFGQIKKLPYTEMAKNKIKAVEEFMSQFEPKEQVSSGGGVGRLVFFIIFVIITIIRIAVSDSNSSRDHNVNTILSDPEFRQMLEYSKKIADSIYQVPKVEIKPMNSDSDLKKLIKGLDNMKKLQKLKSEKTDIKADIQNKETELSDDSISTIQAN